MIKATIKNVASISLVMLLTLSFAVNSFAQNKAYGDNVIVAGDFSGDSLSSAWSSFKLSDDGGAATATIGVTNDEAAITGVTGTDGTSWHIQFNQIFTADQIASLEVGADYEISFDARGAAAKTLVVFFGHNGGGWENYASNVELTTDMQTFTQNVLVTATWGLDDSGMKFGFEGGTSDVDFFIDNVQLRKVEDNIVVNGGFSENVLVPNENDTTGAWRIEGSQGDVAIVDGELAITNITGTGNPWEVQVHQRFTQEQLDSIYVGPYTISFDARTSEGTQDVHLFIGEVGGGWARYLSPDTEEGRITVDTEMKTYTRDFGVDQTWENMRIGFEANYAAGDIFIDNVVFRRVSDVVPDAPQFTLSTEDGIVTVTVTDNGAASYDVFFADSAFTESTGGTLVGTIDPAVGFTFEHTTKAPHPTLVSTFDAHYGVVAKSAKGSSSDLTGDMINTSMSVAENYAVELSEEAVEAVAGALETGVVPDGATLGGFFPEGYVPFTINDASSVLTEGSSVDSDADLSAKFWVGFENVTGGDLMVIYAEITDDMVVPAANAENGGGGWNFDSWEGGIASYEPESFIRGSDHGAFESGDEPDYQLRAGFMELADPYIHAWDGDAGTPGYNQLVGNSQTIGDSSQAGVYRLLTVLSTIEFSGVNTGARDFEYPTGAAIKTWPFNIAVNDNDGSGRDAQYSWSPNSTSQWWNTPSEWQVIAFVGADAIPMVSNEEFDSTPLRFTLEQNYPNPFNPSTNIQFSLPSSSDVTLEVFNMLGQKVATLLSNEKMSAGSHTQKFDASSLASGMYVYRITAANFVQSRTMMLIK